MRYAADIERLAGRRFAFAPDEALGWLAGIETRLKAYAARMLGDGIAAEDVSQDSFLALYRHLHQVPPGAYWPWLYRVARNLCLDQLRRRKFKLSLFRDLQKDDDQPFTPAELERCFIAGLDRAAGRYAHTLVKVAGSPPVLA